MVHHGGQIIEQGMLITHAAALAVRQAVAPKVKTAHRIAPAIELLRHMFVTPTVFAQAVHDKHLGAHRRRVGQRPVAQCQLQARRKA